MPLSLIHLRAAVDEVTAAAAVTENSYMQCVANGTDLDTQLRALQGRYDTLKTAYDLLVSPSGEPMPTGDLPGWRLAWAEDFDTDVAEGGFRATYPNIGLYPPKPGQVYTDTSKRGRYDPDILSVAGSVLRKRIHTTPDGIHHVAAILPRLSDVGQYGAVSGGRFAVRFRADLLPTYKLAWLLWPNDGVWPENGEIDFPECDLGGAKIYAFHHNQDAHQPPGGIGGSDQVRRTSTTTPDSWHTAVIEWQMGRSCAFFLDGVQLGTTITARVPKTPMRWTLQTETILDKKIPVDATVAGNIEIDWLCFHEPA